MAKAATITQLDCHAPARTGIEVVLKQRLDEMCALRSRALDFKDPEGVHDMRVSSRRLRSALRDFGPFLRRGKLAGPVDRIKELADALGEVRDDDVAIMELQKIQAEAPPERAAQIQKLIDMIELKRKEAQRTLVSLLTLKNLNELKQQFGESLPAALTPPKRKKKDELPYGQMAARVVRERVSELKKLSGCLLDPLQAKRLHRMRIAAKRLRYAVELYAPCFSDRGLGIARQIANMQSSLGGLHDCDVWIEYFGDWLADEKPTDKEQPDERRDAMVWLLGHFTKLRAKYFRESLSQWRDWERKDLLQKLLSIHTESETPKTAESERQVAETGQSTKAHSVVTESEKKVGSRKSKTANARSTKDITPVKRDVTLEELNGEESRPPEQQLARASEAAAGNGGSELHRIVKLGEAEESSTQATE